MDSFIRPFIHLLINPFIDSFISSTPYSFARLLAGTLTNSLTHSSIHQFKSIITYNIKLLSQNMASPLAISSLNEGSSQEFVASICS